MRTDAELRGELLAELRRLRQVVPEITGCLIASTDGLLIVDDAQAVVVEGVAALAAACLGVSQRIADSAGHGEFQEVVIRSGGGHVAMYTAGNGAVLVLLADADANVGRLHHEARRATQVVTQVVAAAALSFAQTLPEAHRLPEPEPAPW
ncbi:roadblock/LC7 domain-containing protein [Dactylosporangium roseum]|uniref:Roadblock/LC7 domain-containing protein n=1 Tax=Dactylosporangium roseum TaxID=47989 RepID=A0ABY5Z3T3_9ACTN|nr:roadblock/LC7 domain-containing protein [Dactylosporangium roseum]UWZ35517.1 roadblock/LC7 domain-containing protein [Dactylosporangium roseum]